MTSHPLLHAFRSNRMASYGIWLTLPGLFHARTVAQAQPELGWIVIDCEHGLIPLVPGAAESVAGIKGAARVDGGPSTIVRIPATGLSDSTSWQIKYALDADAHGVLVPMVIQACYWYCQELTSLSDPGVFQGESPRIGS